MNTPLILSSTAVLAVACISIWNSGQDLDLETETESIQLAVSTPFDLPSSFDFQTNNVESAEIGKLSNTDAFLNEVTQAVFDIDSFNLENPVAEGSSSVQPSSSPSSVQQVDYPQSELSREPQKGSVESETFENWLELNTQQFWGPE